MALKQKFAKFNVIGVTRSKLNENKNAITHVIVKQFLNTLANLEIGYKDEEWELLFSLYHKLVKYKRAEQRQHLINSVNRR